MTNDSSHSLDRRRFIARSSAVATGAWITPSIVKYERAAAIGSGPCPNPVNVAPAGTATQISTGFGGVASRGNDGNTNGQYFSGSVFHTLRHNAAWWQVDLGVECFITEVRIYNRTDCCQFRARNVRLQIGLTDPPTPNLGVFPGTTGNWAGPSSITNINGLGRYVRVTNGQRHFFHLAEIEVLAC